MANPNPAADLAAKAAALSPYTVGSGSVTLTVGGNVFVGPVLAVRADVPDRAVFARNVEGAAPAPYIGAVIDKDFYRFAVEVTVRSEPGQYADGEDLLRGLLEKLHRSPPTGYVATLAQQSGPQYLGEDEQRHHEWLAFVELWWKG